MDLVVNHTSDEHEWFQRSRRGDPAYADYYHWHPGPPGEPPNNWESFFGGPAWSYDEEREAWYLHVFDERQPDLDWRNPAVREAIDEMVSWWLEKGIDGFRLDAINHLSKTEGYPDGDPDAAVTGSEQYTHGPRIREYLRELCDPLSGEDVVGAGEMGGTTSEQAREYLAIDGLDMIFQFEHLRIDGGPDGRWDLEEYGDWELPALKEIFSRRQGVFAETGWDPLFLGNHDEPRSVSRFGDDDTYRYESATLLATFLLTMRGTPFVYQGEEIGMTNTEFDSLEAIDDPMTVGIVEELLAGGFVSSYEEIRDLVNYRSRDHARTPMQWSGDDHAGFTDGEPWLAVNPNYESISVASEEEREQSILQYYRELIDLRERKTALVYGDYELLAPDEEQLYAYARTLVDERFLVVLNWSPSPASIEDTDIALEDATAVVGNYDAPFDGRDDRKRLRAYEAIVYRQ
jgi:oligo-1,6-glucosidase